MNKKTYPYAVVAALAAAVSLVVACAPPPPEGGGGDAAHRTEPTAPGTSPTAPQCPPEPPASGVVSTPVEATTAGEVAVFTVAPPAPSGAVYKWRVADPQSTMVDLTTTSPTLTRTPLLPGTLFVSVRAVWDTALWPGCPSWWESPPSSTRIDVLPSEQMLAAAETQLVSEINELRTTQTVPATNALTVHPDLTTGARKWSAVRLADGDAPVHDPEFLADVAPTGTWSAVRENVWMLECSPHPACSSASALAAEAHAGFVNSQVHRANMALPGVSHVGIGFAVTDRPGPGFAVAVTERFTEPG